MPKTCSHEIYICNDICLLEYDAERISSKWFVTPGYFMEETSSTRHEDLCLFGSDISQLLHGSVKYICNNSWNISGRDKDAEIFLFGGLVILLPKSYSDYFTRRNQVAFWITKNFDAIRPNYTKSDANSTIIIAATTKHIRHHVTMCTSTVKMYKVWYPQT